MPRAKKAGSCACGRVASENIVQWAIQKGAKRLVCDQCKGHISLDGLPRRGVVFLVTFDRYYRGDLVRAALSPVTAEGDVYTHQWPIDALNASRQLSERRDGFPLLAKHLQALARRFRAHAHESDTHPSDSGWLLKSARRLAEMGKNLIVQIAALENSPDGVPRIDL